MHLLLSGIELIAKGGWMMFPLLGSGVIALAIFIERVITFKKFYETPFFLTQQVFQYIQENKFESAKQLCKTKATPITSTLMAGIEQIHHSIEDMELTMKNRAESWVPLLERRIDWLDTIITAAPLLGLLGTITGMMSSFDVLSEKGVNEPQAITGGVAEALIATAAGLFVALLGLLAYNILNQWIKNLIYNIEANASRLIEFKLSLKHKEQNQS